MWAGKNRPAKIFGLALQPGMAIVEVILEV
jgi:hypothetical protein